MSSPETRLEHLLQEALATERALITTLNTHLAQTPPGPYRRLLERHLHETRAHAVTLSSRLASPTNVAGLVHTAAGQLFSLAKGPLDLVRGRGATPDLLKNARDECASEAYEIALYDAIEALALALDDEDTAALAQHHREDEERMLADLRACIPALAAGSRAAPTLPIDDYDDLNAGQITARLGDLSQSDLKTVLDYERRHRNRRSVVERAAQLQATPPWPGYDDDNAETILARLTPAHASQVRDYESRHRRRVTILEAAQQQLTN